MPVRIPPSRSHAFQFPWCRAAMLFAWLPIPAVADPETMISAAWDSAYVTEGRDNIGEGGLMSGTIDIAWGPVALSGWAAHGDSVDYREYNLGIGYSFSIGEVGATIGYTRLEFEGIGEGPGDNEVSLRILFPLPGALELTVGGRYSTEAAGAFWEAVAQRSWTLAGAGATVAPYVLVGVDQGYSTGDYDGLNHVEAGIAVEYPLDDALTLSVYCAHCWGLGDVDRHAGEDITWGGARLALAF